MVQLLDHAERWAPHFLMGTAAGVVPLLLERLDLESHHSRHESEPAIRHYLLLLLHAVCQGGAESLLPVFRQSDGARVLTRLLQGPCGMERPAASTWEAEEAAADVVDRAAHAGGPSLMRVGGAAGAGRAWRTQQRVAERSLVPGVWHYNPDFSAPSDVADAAARATHWEREEEELGTCLALVCWCLAPDSYNRRSWGAWLLEYPFVAAVLRCGGVSETTMLRSSCRWKQGRIGAEPRLTTSARRGLYGCRWTTQRSAHTSVAGHSFEPAFASRHAIPFECLAGGDGGGVHPGARDWRGLRSVMRRHAFTGDALSRGGRGTPQTVQGAVVDASWGGALLTLPNTAMPAWDQAMRSALWPHLKKAALLRVLVSLKVTLTAAL